LGANTSLSQADATYYSYIRFYQEVLRHFSSNYYIGLGYNLDDHYDIKDYGDVTDFQEYNAENNNGATKTISSGPLIHFMYDSRKNINNPDDALYASIIYRTNFTFLGSTQNWQYLQMEIRKYIKLNSRDVLALWSWNEFTNGPAPFFDLPANQWDTYSNTARGYIQGFYRGTNFVYVEAEYRFVLSHNGLFGGVVFSNAGSATQWPSNKFQYVDPGEGVGLRIKFNKYSDVNLCIDYAVGLHNGSQGLFFNLGEVF
jgi:outer membrane protein assembly factor BamA